jgi:hypothetical protein
MVTEFSPELKVADGLAMGSARADLAVPHERGEICVVGCRIIPSGCPP